MVEKLTQSADQKGKSKHRLGLGAGLVAILLVYVIAFGPFCGFATHVPIVEGAVRVLYRPLVWITASQVPAIQPWTLQFLKGYANHCDGGNVAARILADAKRPPAGNPPALMPK